MRHQHRWRSKTIALSSTRMGYHTEWMMDADRMVRGSFGRNSRKVGMLGRWDFPNSHHPLKFFVFFSSNDSDELPHDASKDSYACVAYLRKEINKQVYCTLVMANAKVVTRKALSIPDVTDHYRIEFVVPCSTSAADWFGSGANLDPVRP